MNKQIVSFRFHKRTIRKLIRLAEAKNKTKTAIAESLIWTAPLPTPTKKRNATKIVAAPRSS